MLTTGEWFALASLVAGGAGVYAAIRVELARLATSFGHVGDTLGQIRDDIHEMRTELRRDLESHSNKLDDYGQRLAVLEAKQMNGGRHP